MMRRQSILLLACILFLSPFVGAQESPKLGEESAQKDLRVVKDHTTPMDSSASAIWIVVCKEQEKNLLPIESGTPLQSHDKIALQLFVDKPSYVYTLFRSNAGKILRLYPEQGDEQVEANGQRRVPKEDDTWIELDERVGYEHLFVVASEKPLSTEKLHALIQGWLKDHPTEAKKIPLATDRPTSGSRKSDGSGGSGTQTNLIVTSKLLTASAFRSLGRGLFVARGSKTSLDEEPHRAKIAYFVFPHRKPPQ